MQFRSLIGMILFSIAVCLTPCAGADGAVRTDTMRYDRMSRTDVLVVGATPCGIAAAIAAARSGSDVILAEPKDHMGGMMANGLGRTDIGPRNTVGGIFKEFIGKVHAYYVNTYGADSQQVKDCSNGYFFEPSVAERILNEMVSAEKRISVRYGYTPYAAFVYKDRVHGVTFRDAKRKDLVQIRAAVTVDASYEGDASAMAGVAYRIGRESREEYSEPYAGVLYLDHLTRMVLPGTTGYGDRRVQAYNFRLCLTKNPANRVIPEKAPDGYNRSEYLQVLDSIKRGRIKRIDDVLNIERIPNEKSDTNNMPLSLISTDLPEENYTYPEAGPEERERIVKRHRNYILGLIYFLQNDPEMPEALRTQCGEWGFAKDEYTDNDHFPRQIYVREARRIWGLYNFTAYDAMLAPGLLRAPIHTDSIACGGYSIDSHATRKKEPGQDAELEGFFWLSGITQPYQIPYGVMVPQKIDGLLTPGAVSASHLGFGTLRMEPVWMALGEAAGTAAHVCRALLVEPRNVPVNRLQSLLVAQDQVITVFNDIQGPTDQVSAETWRALQFYGTRGFFNSYDAKPLDPITRGTAAQWLMSTVRTGDFMPYFGPFVKHNGGGTEASSLQQLEKLLVTTAGDDTAPLTQCEFANWLAHIAPWIDGSVADRWIHNVKPRESVIEVTAPPAPDEVVTRGEFCRQLFAKFRSVTPGPVY